MQADSGKEPDIPQRPATCPPNLTIPSTTVSSKGFSNVINSVKTTFGVEFRITKSPQKKKLSIEESIQLRSLYNYTDAQYDGLQKATGAVVSISTVKRHENQIFKEMYINRGEKLEDFVLLVTKAVERSSTIFGEVIKVTVGGDKGGFGENTVVFDGVFVGGNDTKVGFFLNDELNPLSPSNLTIVCCYPGDETSENLRPIMKNIDAGIRELKNGVFTKKGFKKFEL